MPNIEPRLLNNEPGRHRIATWQARELETTVHDRLYYTAVENASKSVEPQGEPRAEAPSSVSDTAEPTRHAAPKHRGHMTQKPEHHIPMPKLSLWRRMQIPVIAAAVYWAVRLIGPTLRVEIVGVHNAVQIREDGETGIGAFWHRCIFPAVWIWRNRRIVVLNTVNFDGQWTRRVIERLGFGTVQGSSTRGGLEGLAMMARRLDEGSHVAFTIDGPRGPRYVAKPGAVILSRRTGKPITAFYIAVKTGHTFKKSWDQFRLPYPFSRAVMFVAPLIRVPSDADSEVMKAKQAELQAALELARDVAESWFQLDEKARNRIREEWSETGSRRRPAPRSPQTATTTSEA
jgi:lysophospholipid acyltransferase (LPLAT)-like uncharacterized protein